tara:strand:+ start:2708 stop:3028 length:321 start_codon:yes stop_codon:yes gene_type:complete
MNKAELEKLKKEELVDLLLEKIEAEATSLAVIEDMQATIEELNQQRKDEAGGKKVITVGKERYLVVTPSFKLDGKKYGFADLKTDEKLVKEVLKIEGQNILQPENS